MPTRLPTITRSGYDNSILGTHGRCPRLDLYDYHLGRVGRGNNYPINFGIAYHSFRETLEKLYLKWVIEETKSIDSVKKLLYQTSWAVASKEWTDPPIEHKKSYLDLTRLEIVCEESFESWLGEKARGAMKVIATETAFDLPLPRKLCRRCWEWSDPEYTLCLRCGGPLFTEYFQGRFDQILEWNRRLWVRDFKTVGRREDWRAKFSPAHQFTGYTWAAQILSGRRIDGVIAEVVYNTKTMGPEFHPTFASRSANDIEMWLEWVEFETANRRRAEATDIWPMRTTACGDYGGCFFRECCNLGNWSSIETWLEDKTIHSVWDPLNPEREEGIPE